MTYSDEHVARLEAQADAAATERRQLRAIIAQVRAVLGTPDNASVVQYARDVMADAQRARDDLAQAQAWIAMLEADMRTALEQLQESRSEAVRAAVPWDVFYGVVYGMGDDCMDDLRQWFLMHAPQEARNA